MSQSLDLVDFHGPIVETNQTTIFGLFFVVQKTDERVRLQSSNELHLPEGFTTLTGGAFMSVQRELGGTTFKEAISRCLQMLSLRSWFHPIFWYVFVLCRAQHSLKSFKQLGNHHFKLEVKYTFQQAEPFKTENLIFHLSTCRKTSSFQVMQQNHLPNILVVQNNEKKKRNPAEKQGQIPQQPNS